MSRVAERVGIAPSSLPRIVVVQGFLPFALVARGLGGRGSILLSQGLLAGLNEASLRKVLESCIERSREGALPIRSLFSTLWILLAAITPRPRSVFGAFGFLLMYPFLNFVAALAGVGRKGEPRFPMDLLSDGAAHLYVIDPKTNPVVFRG